MKTEQISAEAFKEKCLQLINDVSKHHIELTITKDGNPIAKLVPATNERFSSFGCMKGSAIIKGNIVSSTGEKWEADE